MGLLGKDSSPEEFPASVSMSGEGAPGPTLPCGSKLRPGRELHGKPQGPSQAQGKAPMPGKGATPTPGSRGPTLWRGPQRPPGLFSYSRAGVFSLTRALALDGTGPPPPSGTGPPQRQSRSIALPHQVLTKRWHAFPGSLWGMQPHPGWQRAWPAASGAPDLSCLGHPTPPISPFAGKRQADPQVNSP